MNEQQSLASQCMVWPEMAILHILLQSAQAAISTLEAVYPDVWATLSGLTAPGNIDHSSLEDLAACIIHNAETMSKFVASYVEVAGQHLDDMASGDHVLAKPIS